MVFFLFSRVFDLFVLVSSDSVVVNLTEALMGNFVKSLRKVKEYHVYLVVPWLAHDWSELAAVRTTAFVGIHAAR